MGLSPLNSGHRQALEPFDDRGHRRNAEKPSSELPCRDGVNRIRRSGLWIPAFAGMTGLIAGMTGLIACKWFRGSFNIVQAFYRRLQGAGVIWSELRIKWSRHVHDTGEHPHWIPAFAGMTDWPTGKLVGWNAIVSSGRDIAFWGGSLSSRGWLGWGVFRALEGPLSGRNSPPRQPSFQEEEELRGAAGKNMPVDGPGIIQ